MGQGHGVLMHPHYQSCCQVMFLYIIFKVPEAILTYVCDFKSMPLTNVDLVYFVGSLPFP